MKNSKYYRNIVAKGLLNQFAIKYVDEHRKELKKLYKKDVNFVEDFYITDEMLDELKLMADVEKIEFNQDEFEKCKPLLRTYLKGLIGRDIYDSETYFKVINLDNDIFKEALRVINSDEYDTLLNNIK